MDHDVFCGIMERIISFLAGIIVLIMAVNAPMEFRYDLNKNNIPETYSLENNIVTITENGKQLWQTPEDWHIDDVIIADSNNDGIIEINLLLWKSGNYGSSQPFWIKTNDDSIKNHFFLYTLENDQIKSVWQSSNLDKPNCSAQIKDVDHDGKNELVVLEGEYTEPYKCEPKYKSVWKWSEWGFYLDDRLDY